MRFPGPSDWSFNDIIKCCRIRAELLEGEIEAEALTGQLERSIVEGIKGSARFGLDHDTKGRRRYCCHARHAEWERDRGRASRCSESGASTWTSACRCPRDQPPGDR